jgi:hypothetical protein
MSASTAPAGLPGCRAATSWTMSTMSSMFSSAMAMIMSSLLAKYR